MTRTPEGSSQASKTRRTAALFVVASVLALCALGITAQLIVVGPTIETSREVRVVLVVFFACLTVSAAVAAWQLWNIQRALNSGRDIPRVLLAKATTWIRTLLAGIAACVVLGITSSEPVLNLIAGPAPEPSTSVSPSPSPTITPSEIADPAAAEPPASDQDEPTSFLEEYSSETIALLVFLAVGALGVAIGPGYADYAAIWDHLERKESKKPSEDEADEDEQTD